MDNEFPENAKIQKLSNLSEAIIKSFQNQVEALLPDNYSAVIARSSPDNGSIFLVYNGIYFDEIPVQIDNLSSLKDEVLAKISAFDAFYKELDALGFELNRDPNEDDDVIGTFWLSYDGILLDFYNEDKLLENKDKLLASAKNFNEFYPLLKEYHCDFECSWRKEETHLYCNNIDILSFPSGDTSGMLAELLALAKKFNEAYPILKAHHCCLKNVGEEILLTYNNIHLKSVSSDLSSSILDNLLACAKDFDDFQRLISSYGDNLVREEYDDFEIVLLHNGIYLHSVKEEDLLYSKEEILDKAKEFDEVLHLVQSYGCNLMWKNREINLTSNGITIYAGLCDIFEKKDVFIAKAKEHALQS